MLLKSCSPLSKTASGKKKQKQPHCVLRTSFETIKRKTKCLILTIILVLKTNFLAYQYMCNNFEMLMNVLQDATFGVVHIASDLR